MSGEEFLRLLDNFEKYVNRVPYKRNRKRKWGAGRPHTLHTSDEKLFFILFYMKCYPTMDVAGFFFGVDRSQIKRWVDALEKKLEKALGYEMALPPRRMKSVQEFLERFPMIKEILIDGTERPVQRPKNKKKQKERYSGKKKKHTQKNVVVASKKKKILFLGPTVEGHVHDYPMLRQSKLPEHIPPDVISYMDLGFKGIQKDYDLKIRMPYRKPRTTDLTDKQKAFNKKTSRLRVRVENAIAGIKRLRCLTDICRTKSEELKDRMMWLGCGLWNFHLATA